MKQILFSIYDSKAQAYFPPFCLHNPQMAIRQFSDMVNDQETRISKHPEDYTLFQIGEFDDSNAKINISKDSPKSLSNGIQLVLSSNPIPSFEPDDSDNKIGLTA